MTTQAGISTKAKIIGISATLPKKRVEPMDAVGLFTEQEIEKVVKNIGVHQRFVVEDLCTSDLCLDAAERLLNEMSVPREEIDVLIYVTQTPDYVLPATSCILQDKLGLSKTCAAFDVNLGCSGYVYGLWMASSFVQSGFARNVLLLVGDTISKTVSEKDKATYFLFGDAGTATLISADDNAGTYSYVIGSDGAGAHNLIIENGSYRNKALVGDAANSFEDGGHHPDYLYIDGAAIFSFTLHEVKKMMKDIMAKAGREYDDLDLIVMHQANAFMLKHLVKSLKLPKEKCPIVIGKYGNTSSASIPLTLCDEDYAPALRSGGQELVLAGFGVGYSWAAIHARVGNLIIPPINHI